MKIYIATYHQYNNYGTRLQNYALCKAVETLGGEPITLHIRDLGDVLTDAGKEILSRLPLVDRHQRLYALERKKIPAFAAFLRELNMLTLRHRDLYRLDFSDAIAIAGSDQIWLPTHLKRRGKERDLYFLSFAPEGKRFAYAPSFGWKRIPEDMRETYRSALTKFSALSAREAEGVEIIRSLTGCEAAEMPDPVFLLNRDAWKRLIASVKTPRPAGSYVLVYCLSKQGARFWESVGRYARERGLPVVRVEGYAYHRGANIPGPPEFLRLIDGARAIFTDSFHCSAFSIILQTPFAVCRRTDVEQFSRIENLASYYHMRLSSEENGNGGFFALNDNFDGVEALLEQKRRIGLDYLRGILQSGRSGEC